MATPTLRANPNAANPSLSIALTQIGFDATSSEVNRFLGGMFSDHRTVTDGDLIVARKLLQESNPGKSWLSKKDLQRAEAMKLVGTKEGRSLLREVLRGLTKEELLDLLGVGN